MLQAERMPDLVEVMRMGKDHRLKQRQLPLQVDENLTVSQGLSTILFFSLSTVSFF
jgi:hypothetical protein